ncbi:MAG: hypothetical protein AB7S74_13975 [Hyphomicrobium sp.]
MDHPGDKEMSALVKHYAALGLARIERLIAQLDSSQAADLVRLLSRVEGPGSPKWRKELIEKLLHASSVNMRDAAVQAVESWAEPGLADVLRNHKEHVSWLARYKEQVIADITGGS